MADEWPKEIEYKGATITLTQRLASPSADYGYKISGGTEGLGFQTAAMAKIAARRAVDRKLAREARE